MQQTLPPPTRAFPSSSLALPDFSKEISECDDRLIHLSQLLQRTIKENLHLHKPQSGSTLELEAKIGQISMSENPVFREYLSAPSWSVCMPAKINGAEKSLYGFKAGIVGDQLINEATIFNSVQQYFSSKSKQPNPVFTESYERTKDEFVSYYENGSKHQARLTYKFDAHTNQYSPTPSEILKKDRLADVNIRGGTSGLHFVGDLRFSTSQELKFPQGWKVPESGNLEQTRFKERHKFQFQYLVFDLTKSTQHSRYGQEPPTYEIEVEVADLPHLLANLDNFMSFNKIIRRYLQNVGSISHLIARTRADLSQKYSQAVQNSEQTLLEYEKQAEIAYASYYGQGAPRSLIQGSDYLASVAVREIKKSANGTQKQ